MKRECGECSLCCKLTRVHELNKLERDDCIHCDNGCSIYNNRPISCVNFECAWLSGCIPERFRPDKCGVMVEVHRKFIFVMSDGDEWKQMILTLQKSKFPLIIKTLEGTQVISNDIESTKKDILDFLK